MIIGGVKVNHMEGMRDFPNRILVEISEGKRIFCPHMLRWKENIKLDY
jgi:hypothetical protein